MSVIIYYTLPGSQMDSFSLDAAVTLQHTSRGDVTDYPVETGTAVSDHKRVLPDRLRIDGIISNTPLPSKVGAAPEQFREDMEQGVYAFRGENAYYALLAIHQSGIAVSISTELRQYDLMVLENLDVPQSVESGDSIRFSADFRQIMTVDSQTVQALTRLPKAAKQSTGTQPKKPVEDAQARPDSMLRAGGNAITGGDLSKFLSGTR